MSVGLASAIQLPSLTGNRGLSRGGFQLSRNIQARAAVGGCKEVEVSGVALVGRTAAIGTQA